MEVNGMIIHCPYWVNKIQEGRVTIRGFSNGKGSASEIRQELIKQIGRLSIDREHLTSEYIRKLAKRNRIGIDCSGFVYRMLDTLIHLGYAGSAHVSLGSIFSGGINKTNARILTSREFSLDIQKVKDVQVGDMIRLKGGHHVVIVVKKTPQTITYAHSSHQTTKIKGVHIAKINITDKEKPIQNQQWLEETNRGENFGEKFFYQEKGDGVYRLKIFGNSIYGRTH